MRVVGIAGQKEMFLILKDVGRERWRVIVLLQLRAKRVIRRRGRIGPAFGLRGDMA